jgi:very-short-patch-repair endonuclease
MQNSLIRLFARELRKNQTKAESVFWQNVRKRQIMGFRFLRQFVISHSNLLGKKQYFIADFYCKDLSLVVEIDGRIHDFQKEHDQVKNQILEELGYKVIRFPNEEVLSNWDLVEKKLKEVISNQKRNPS